MVALRDAIFHWVFFEKQVQVIQQPPSQWHSPSYRGKIILKRTGTIAPCQAQAPIHMAIIIFSNPVGDASKCDPFLLHHLIAIPAQLGVRVIFPPWVGQVSPHGFTKTKNTQQINSDLATKTSSHCATAALSTKCHCQCWWQHGQLWCLALCSVQHMFEA